MGILSERPALKDALDFLFSSLFATPLVVLFWRGTFNALVHWAIEGYTIDQRWKPALTLCLTGLTVKILIDLLKHWLSKLILSYGNFIRLSTSTVMIYVDAVASVAFWVGGFNLLYVFPGTSWEGMCSVLALASGLLMAIQGFHSTGGLPLRLMYDNEEGVLKPVGYLGCTSSDGWFKLSADIILSYSIGHSLVISCWWSLWELENHYILYPSEITMKDKVVWDSIVIGYLAALVVLTLVGPVKNMEQGAPKMVAGNALALIAMVSSLNVWRGFWSIWNYHFLPEFELQDNLLISHFVGFSGSIICRVGINLTQSFSKDSSIVDIYSCDYLGHFTACFEGPSEEEERPILN